MAAPATYSFQVQVPNDDDVRELREGGYHLGVVKKGKGRLSHSTIPIQWLSIDIGGGLIDVSWNDEFFLFFTTQDLSHDGAQIMQEGNTIPAMLGNKYSYTGVFSQVGPAGSPDGIEIENNLRSGHDSYGISQKVLKNGQLVQAPIIASGILMKGTVGFSFAEEVEVYFTNDPKYVGRDGVVAKHRHDRCSSTCIRLTPNVMTAVEYDLTCDDWSPGTKAPPDTDVERGIRSPM